MITVEELAQAVCEYLAADRSHRSEPCLHRYRGIVRTREKARRARVWREAGAKLDRLLALVGTR